MAAAFGAVLLCSFVLEQIFSPMGNAVLDRVDRRAAVLDGTVVAASGQSFMEFRGIRRTYLLSNPSAVVLYLGKQVRISGVLYESSGLLEVQSILSAHTK
jgi:hypothetical protein